MRAFTAALGLVVALTACTTSSPPPEELPFSGDTSGSPELTTTQTPPPTLATAASTPTSEGASTTVAEIEDLVTALDGAIRVTTFCDLQWAMSTRKRLLNVDGDPAVLLEAYFKGTRDDLFRAAEDAPTDAVSNLAQAIALMDAYIAEADAVGWDAEAPNTIPADVETLDTAIANIEATASNC